MKVCRSFGLLLGIHFLFALSAFSQGSYKAEGIGAAPAAVPAAVQSTLDAQGVKVTADGSATLCEVWLRAALPINPNPNTSPDVLYGSLPEGAFLGVLHFPKDTTDFRSQTIKAGFYSVRFGLIPQDGNHMGVSPSRDAFVLSPLAADSDPNKVLKFEDMVKLSQQASGTPHPGFLVGSPVNGSTFPSIAKDDSGNWVLQLKGHQGSIDFPLAFTVVGKWQG